MEITFFHPLIWRSFIHKTFIPSVFSEYMVQPVIEKIEEILIRLGIEIARKGEGALFVISDSCEYKRLLKQKIKPFSLFEKGAQKILVSIATIDGAVIINKKGIIEDYGALIKSRKVFRGFGTRHSAAYSASLCKNTTAILVSQEEKKIKIFRAGKLIMQVDALEKNVDKKISRLPSLLESIGVGTISSIGVSALIPGLGIAVIPGIIIFGAPYYLIKRFTKG